MWWVGALKSDAGAQRFQHRLTGDAKSDSDRVISSESAQEQEMGADYPPLSLTLTLGDVGGESGLAKIRREEQKWSTGDTSPLSRLNVCYVSL